MIDYTIIIHDELDVNEKLLSEEDVLNLIDFPLQKYIENLCEEDKEIMVDLIFEELLDLEDDPTDISDCEIIKDPVFLDGDINIIGHIFKDCNYTDKGIEDLSFVLGYELVTLYNC